MKKFREKLIAYKESTAIDTSFDEENDEIDDRKDRWWELEDDIEDSEECCRIPIKVLVSTGNRTRDTKDRSSLCKNLHPKQL